MKRSVRKKILSHWRDRWKPVWVIVEWPLLIALAVITLSFGVIGFTEYFNSRHIILVRLASTKDHAILCSLGGKGCWFALSPGR